MGDFTLGKSRFEAFSDGIFTIAITLLILEIRLPGGGAFSLQRQTMALLLIWPQYLVYAATFATVGIMWLNHHALSRSAERITHGVVLANLLLLGLISFLPFATEVIARFGLTPVSVVYYGLNLSAIAFAFLILQRQIMAAHPETNKRMGPWNFVGLTLYPIGTVIGSFAPLIGILTFAALAVFYMIPRNVESAAIHPQ